MSYQSWWPRKANEGVVSLIKFIRGVAYASVNNTYAVSSHASPSIQAFWILSIFSAQRLALSKRVSAHVLWMSQLNLRAANKHHLTENTITVMNRIELRLLRLIIQHRYRIQHQVRCKTWPKLSQGPIFGTGGRRIPALLVCHVRVCLDTFTGFRSSQRSHPALFPILQSNFTRQANFAARDDPSQHIRDLARIPYLSGGRVFQNSECTQKALKL